MKWNPNKSPWNIVRAYTTSSRQWRRGSPSVIMIIRVIIITIVTFPYQQLPSLLLLQIAILCNIKLNATGYLTLAWNLILTCQRHRRICNCIRYKVGLKLWVLKDLIISNAHIHHKCKCVRIILISNVLSTIKWLTVGSLG